MSAPAVTVKDVWRSVLPDGTDLIAGDSGLDRRVEWACALRARPPAFDAVKGGEMAFIPVSRIHVLDERLDLGQVIAAFAEKGGVAVAISGDPTQRSIALADALMMPLLRLPDAAHVNDVHQACIRFILDQRTLLHERAQELQTSMMQLAFSGAGVAAIVEHLSRLTHMRSAWIDPAGTFRHDTELSATGAAATTTVVPAVLRWAETVDVIAADPLTRAFRIDAKLELLGSPVPARHGLGGVICTIGPSDDLNQEVRLAVSRAAAACAIELDRERIVSETREELEGDFVDALLAGAYVDDDTAVERARRLGASLGPWVQVIALRPSRADPAWQAAATAAVRNSVVRHEEHALVGAHAGAVCAVFSADVAGMDAAERLADDVRAACARGTGDEGVSAGIGRPHGGPSGVRHSFREAEQALGLAEAALGHGITASFSRLGLYRLLFSIAQHPEVSGFYDETVGRIVDYDRRTGGGLMETLDAFFESNASPTEAAQRLKLHRNTVLYRLRRIEEIGKVRLDDPMTRLNLHLCMRLREVMAHSIHARPMRGRA